MDNFAKCFGYHTEDPAYQTAIQNAEHQGLPVDGSQHPVEDASLVEKADVIPKHGTAPPPEPVFPEVSCRYSALTKQVVFTFSKHSNRKLRKHLGNCLLKFWSPDKWVAHKWKKGELRTKCAADDPRIELCLYKIRTLTSNCQVLGYTGEKFVAAAKEIQDKDSILHALCEPSVTFYRDQHGDIGAVTHAATYEDKAILDCEEILLNKGKYEAAYAVAASRGEAAFAIRQHEHLAEQQHPESAPPLEFQWPEGKLILSFVKLANLMSLEPTDHLSTKEKAQRAQEIREKKFLATEFLLRSMDRRADSVEYNVQNEVFMIAHSLDKETLDGLYRKHGSDASRFWLRRVIWSRQDGEAFQNFEAALEKCSCHGPEAEGSPLRPPAEGRMLSEAEVQELRDMVLAAVMMDPRIEAFSLACKGLDFVYQHASPGQSYLIFMEAMLLLDEKRDSMPFDNEQQFLKGLGESEQLRRFAAQYVDEDSDPIVVSDEENSADH